MQEFRSPFDSSILIRLVNLKARAPYDLYIGRGNFHMNLPASKWGNPIKLKRETERWKCLKGHLLFILSRPDLLESLHELDGLTLACYCDPKPCHGRTLAEMRLLQLAGGLQCIHDSVNVDMTRVLPDWQIRKLFEMNFDDAHSSQTRA